MCVYRSICIIYAQIYMYINTQTIKADSESFTYIHIQYIKYYVIYKYLI